MAGESISRFFERLGFALKNERTSWGAANSDTILLRTWSDEYDVRRRRVIVFGWHRNQGGTASTGWNERKAHLRMLWQGGCGAYTVIVNPVDTETNEVRRIRDFRSDAVFPIEGLLLENGMIYAQLSAPVPVGELSKHISDHKIRPNEAPVPAELVDSRSPEPDDPLEKVKFKAQAMREYLIGVAASRSTVTYGELFDAFELNRMTIPKVLAAVGHRCKESNEPILTALVVLKETGRCSTGMEREFGVDEDEERRRVFEHWNALTSVAKSRNGEDWTLEELQATVVAYREMVLQDQTGTRFVKAHYYQQLAKQFGRDTGAYERRMQNVSHLLDVQGLPWLRGLKPQSNIGTRITAILNDSLRDLVAELTLPVLLPEEVEDDDPVMEGAKRQITINAYERDVTARRRCLKRWGTSCVVCGFDFSNAYGELGKGFIHVHHLRPLSTIGAEYELSPEDDLRPVCPNCHAMLHRRREVLSIDELRSILADRTAARSAT